MDVGGIPIYIYILMLIWKLNGPDDHKVKLYIRMELLKFEEAVTADKNRSYRQQLVLLWDKKFEWKNYFSCDEAEQLRDTHHILEIN